MNLEDQLKISKHAVNNWWTNPHYKEHTRILLKVTERCREKYHNNWEDKVRVNKH